MANDAEVWKAMAAKYGLVEPDLWRVASPWHTDLDMGRPLEVMTDMARSRKLGFLVYQSTEEAFHDLFADLARGEGHSLNLVDADEPRAGPPSSAPQRMRDGSRWKRRRSLGLDKRRFRRLTVGEGREDREDPRQAGRTAIG